MGTPVQNLTAKTWPDGKRVDLAWTLPAGVTQIKIRRSSVSFCNYEDDPGEDIYDDVPISAFVDGEYTGVTDTTNVALEENKFYYYTVFHSYTASAPFTWEAATASRVTGLSIRDYYAAEGNYVYALLPREYRRRDAEDGPSQYKLRDLMRGTVQAGLNVYRGWAEGLLQLTDADSMPAGRIGEAFNQTGLLEARSWDLGLPPEKSFDAGVLRRIAAGLVPLYKQKGTCTGLVSFVKLFTGWDSRCDELNEPLCGVNRLFRTWDAESFINRYEPTLTANDADVSVAGEVTLKTSQILDALGAGDTLSDADPIVAFVLDEMGTFACVDSVAVAGGGEQVITFVDPAAQLRKEITGTMTASGMYTITIALGDIDSGTYPWQFPTAEPTFGEGAFVGHEFMDSTGAIFDIVESFATDGSGTELTLGPAMGLPTTGVFSIAKKFDPAGATYAGRLPLLHAKLYTGEFSLTYDPRWDVRLATDGAYGPWSFLTAMGASTGLFWAPTPSDVDIWLTDAHTELGVATAVTSTTLTDSTKLWLVNIYAGLYLLPNWNQKKLYKIVSNTATTLTVTLAEGGGVDTVATIGSHFVILDERAAVKYSRLALLVHSFLPFEERA